MTTPTDHDLNVSLARLMGWTPCDGIGRLFEEYDRLVRWEEHNSRLDATDPVVERAIARGRIVAFIANTATLQQDAHTSMNAEPQPQDVEEAWDDYDKWSQRYFYHRKALDGQRAADARRAIEQAIRADERERWAEREQQLVEERDYYLSLLEQLHRDTHDALADYRAVLNQERPA